ncbi:MAG: hypothetical protein WA821_22585 [Anaerolineales bacterium]
MVDKEQNDPYVLIEQIENAKSQQELESLINALTNLGEPAVDALLEKMPKLVTSRLHNIGAHVFARVGYPANSKALEFMVSDVSNINSSTYEISLNALLKIGAPILPMIEDTLEFYKQQNSEENILEIDSLKELKNLIRK